MLRKRTANELKSYKNPYIDFKRKFKPDTRFRM